MRLSADDEDLATTVYDASPAGCVFTLAAAISARTSARVRLEDFGIQVESWTPSCAIVVPAKPASRPTSRATRIPVGRVSAAAAARTPAAGQRRRTAARPAPMAQATAMPSV